MIPLPSPKYMFTFTDFCRLYKATPQYILLLADVHTKCASGDSGDMCTLDVGRETSHRTHVPSYSASGKLISAVYVLTSLCNATVLC